MNDHLAVIELTPAALRFLDQTRLPVEEVMIETADHRDVLDDDGFRVDQPWWRVVADVNLTIEPGLSQGDGDTDISSVCSG